jgi:hypothetical protein
MYMSAQAVKFWLKLKTQNSSNELAWHGRVVIFIPLLSLSIVFLLAQILEREKAKLPTM